jgi:hypothetical protein
VFGFYFLIDQGVVRLVLRVLDLVKTILLKTLLSAFMEKILIDKKVCFRVLHARFLGPSRSSCHALQITTKE